MTLEQLRIFIAVAEREHVTQAARALNITQSAVSAAIAALEQRHDVVLFDRVGRGIVLTEIGRMFLVEARGVVGRAAAAELVLSEFGGLKRGVLKLVSSQTIGSYWLPPFLARFRAAYPAITIDLTIGNTQEAAASVHDGLAELGFVEGVVDDPALHHWPVGTDRMVLVTSVPRHTVDIAWLKDQPWVMREPGSGTRASLEQALRAHDLDPAALQVALTLPSNESVRRAVECGAGLTGLSATVVARALKADALFELPLDLPVRPFFGLRHKDRHQSKAAAALLAIMSEEQS